MEYTQTEIQLATKIHELQGKIEGLNYEISILNSKTQIQRGRIHELEGMIGHMNMHINNTNNIIDLNYEQEEE
tara:strand:- start:1947 stop:2165 length:219 start_codon:yes stop_codon:yes gene_type:complete